MPAHEPGDALPGLLEPQFVDGRWLFDGALVNPIPVSVCRAMGADIVVAISLQSDSMFRGTVIGDRNIGDETTNALAEKVEEVGRIFKVTRERVRQVEAKAIRKLQHPVRARKLQGFVENPMLVKEHRPQAHPGHAVLPAPVVPQEPPEIVVRPDPAKLPEAFPS